MWWLEYARLIPAAWVLATTDKLSLKEGQAEAAGKKELDEQDGQWKVELPGSNGDNLLKLATVLRTSWGSIRMITKANILDWLKARDF